MNTEGFERHQNIWSEFNKKFIGGFRKFERENRAIYDYDKSFKYRPFDLDFLRSDVYHLRGLKINPYLFKLRQNYIENSLWMLT